MSYYQPDEQGILLPPIHQFPDALTAAQFYLDQAEVSIHGGHYTQAARDLLSADREMLILTNAEREASLLTARAFYLQGLIYFSKQMLGEAQVEFLLAQEHLAGLEDGRQLLVQVLVVMGNTHHIGGQEDEAAIYYHEAAAHATLSGVHMVAVKAYNNIGNISLGQGRVEEAVRFYNLGLEQAHLSGDPVALARSYRTLAWLHSNYGPYHLALEYAVLATEQCELVAGAETRWLIESETARVFARAGEFERAARLLDNAFSIIHQRESKVAEAMVAVNIIELWEAHWRSDPQFRPEGEAIVRSLEEALRSPLLRSEALRGLASYYLHGADLARARHYLALTRQAVMMPGTPNQDDQAIYDHTLARLLTGLGEELEAANWYLETIKLMTTAHLSRYQLACVWREYQALLSHLGPITNQVTASDAEAQARMLCVELGIEVLVYTAC